MLFCKWYTSQETFYPMPWLQPTIHGGNSEITGHTVKEHLSCHQPISEYKLNTGHQCSMGDVKILDFE